MTRILFLPMVCILLACGGDDDGPGGGTDGGPMALDGGAANDGDVPGTDGSTPGTDGSTPGDDGGPTATDAGPPPVDDCADPGSTCIACAIAHAPETEDQCTCIACPVYPATARGCQMRQMQWNRVCGDWQRRNPCPDVLCTEPPPVACVDNTCQVADPTT